MKGSGGGGVDLLSNCKGGGGMFIQYLLKTITMKTEEEKRALIEEYLGLEGIYGQLVVSDSEYEDDDYDEENNNSKKKKMTWKIIRSIFPWNEGKELFQEENDSLMPVFEKDRFLRLEWESSVKEATATM
jgi:hypothetical protein